MTPQFCRRCLYADTHPLGLVIDDEGICSGCRIHEEKDQLDWNERWAALEALVQPYRSASGGSYDCIVPVSGAGDSYFILHLVKERLGLNPLVVAYNRHWNTALGIRNLANLRIRFDVDLLQQTLSPETVRRVTRASLRLLGSIHWHILAGQTVWPVETAVRYGIPLIVWGAHQGLEQVGQFSHLHEVEMTRRYRHDHDLMGHEPDDLVTLFDTLDAGDIAPFRYPDDAALARVGVRGIYLGNYVRWDPRGQHEAMIRTHGYRTAASDRSFDSYDHVDCYTYLGLHDVLKLFRHGYSRVTDHAVREIRHGRMTRAQGLALVRHHESRKPPHVDLFRQWLGLDEAGLQFLLDRHRNSRWWHEEAPGRFRFRGWSTHDAAPPESPQDPGFLVNDQMERGAAPGYVLIGRGWPD